MDWHAGIGEKLTQARGRLSVELAARRTEPRSPMTIASKTDDTKGHHFRIPVGSGMRIAVDAWGNPAAKPVLLLHGGGQTRHAWGGTARVLADAGFYAMALDLRGHGDSDWCDQGDYHPDAFATDLIDVMATVGPKPALVGASLGGMISLRVRVSRPLSGGRSRQSATAPELGIT